MSVDTIIKPIEPLYLARMLSGASKSGKRKRVPLNMRVTADLRSKVEVAALLSGRSLAQEVEHRIEKSFWNEGAGI